MPRIRQIKPQFHLDEDLGTICRDARLLFIGLWGIADDSGVFEWRPLKIKAQLFPYDTDVDADVVESWLQELVKIGDISEPFFNGKKKFGFIFTLTKHQMIQHPSKFRFASAPQGLLNETSMRATTKEKEVVKEKGESESVSAIFDLWNLQEIIQHKKLTDEIKRAIEIKLRDDSEDEVCQSIKNYTEIVKDEQYFFKYKWTLKDFLKRGLEKFKDLEVAKQNYKAEDKIAGKSTGAKQEPRTRKYQPTN